MNLRHLLETSLIENPLNISPLFSTETPEEIPKESGTGRMDGQRVVEIVDEVYTLIKFQQFQ